MNKINMNIWGRSLELSVAFDCYEGEDVLSEQKEALDKLCSSMETIENARTTVENYCIKNNRHDIGEGGITNIFKYVMPYGLFIRRPTSPDRYIGLMCKYRFNPEDGLVVLFKNEKIYDIGTSDIL